MNTCSVSIRLIFIQASKVSQYLESARTKSSFDCPSFHLCSHLSVKSNDCCERDHSCFSSSFWGIHFFIQTYYYVFSFPEVIKQLGWTHFQLERQLFFLLRHSWTLWCLFPRSYFDNWHVDRLFWPSYLIFHYPSSHSSQPSILFFSIKHLSQICILPCYSLPSESSTPTNLALPSPWLQQAMESGNCQIKN